MLKNPDQPPGIIMLTITIVATNTAKDITTLTMFWKRFNSALSAAFRLRSTSGHTVPGR